MTAHSGVLKAAAVGAPKAEEPLGLRIVQVLGGGLVRVFLTVVAPFWRMPTIGLSDTPARSWPDASTAAVDTSRAQRLVGQEQLGACGCWPRRASGPVFSHHSEFVPVGAV